MKAAHVIRINHTVHGRAYLIEVLAVSRDRWRAHIVRSAGGATALMPFYGTTPDDAARQLTGWLSRVGTGR